ncbi:MAG: HNH endonuclease signature motif containing protein [Pseudomonadota bacterium]
MLNSLKQTAASSETGGVERLAADEISKLSEKYNEEVQKYSSDGDLHVTEAETWEKVPLSESREARTDWLMNKREYIKQWQEVNGIPWPRYKSDYVENGQTIRREGDLYDAHHVQPSEFGGKNSAENITPMHAKDHLDHKGIHRPDGPYAELARHFRTV